MDEARNEPEASCTMADPPASAEIRARQEAPEAPEEPATARALAAEEVRAWLVHHRGGAPFLSAADGALLATWLEAGVPVTTLLRAIERVAARRVAKRTRTPFTLRSCEATVRKLQGEQVSWRIPRDIVAALAPEAPDELARAALDELRALPEGDPEARTRAACVVLRRFQERVWESLSAERPALLAAAAEELAPLRDALGSAEFGRACEELARDRVRARYPSLSAARVWEEFGLGLA
jgi:hypothetical protein